MNYLFIGLPVAAAGIFLIVKGIQLTIKSVSGKIILEMNYAQQSAGFQVEKEGKFAIWQTWRGSKRTAFDLIGPAIHNQLNGQNVVLTRPFATRRTNNFTISRIEIFSFYAEAGNYQIEMVKAKSKSLLESFGLNTTAAPTDLSKIGLQIQESKPAIMLVLSILLILFGAFATIAGLVLVFWNATS